MCVDRLRQMLSEINAELDAAPKPLADLRAKAAAHLPIPDCTADTFREVLSSSPYFFGMAEQRNYFIATLTNRNTEVGVAFSKQSGRIEEVYARFEK